MSQPTRHLLLIIALIVSHHALAQGGGEVLVGLESRPTPPAPGATPKSVASALALPFFDDFSYPGGSPRPALWQPGGQALINHSYAINPPSVGVATLDALNAQGQLYPNYPPTPFGADTLTSNPINLQRQPSDSVYLSFAVQPQGLGSPPQPADSLILELLDPQSGLWVGAWAASANFEANTLTEHFRLTGHTRVTPSDTMHGQFFHVHLPITDPRFLANNVQLRFRNIASLSGNAQIPGLRANSDHWHLDLVYLDRARSRRDTLINDVAFFRPLTPVLRSYQRMPWRHFTPAARARELSDSLFHVNYRNLGDVETWNVLRRFTILDESTGSQQLILGGAENVFPMQSVSYTFRAETPFTSAWPDSAKFILTCFIDTGRDPSARRPFLPNDTVRHAQHFINYYAYDDGSAERGYGLYGDGAENGRVAMRFITYQADWLMGVQIYFNRTHNDVNLKNFFLAIWADDHGRPGALLREQRARVDFVDRINGFVQYQLVEPLWIGQGAFHVGWRQTDADFINVGFDLNGHHEGNLSFSLGGDWNPSQLQGIPMLRPTFGYIVRTGAQARRAMLPIALFPNPASHTLHVRTGEWPGELTVALYSMSGRMLLSRPLTAEGLDVSHLPAGLYVVEVRDAHRGVAREKLIISR